MAEIQKEYRELQKEIEESIEDFNSTEENAPLPEYFGAAIMHCLTEREENYSEEGWNYSRQLWEEQDSPKAEWAIGSLYINVQDVVLEILKTLIKNGTVAFLFQQEQTLFNPRDLIEFCYKLIASVNSLDECDICLGYRISKNPLLITRTVNKSDIINWFPGIGADDCSKRCDMTDVDMHYSCKFFNYEDALCTASEKGIIDALDSLEDKGIAKPSNNNTEYRFKW